MRRIAFIALGLVVVAIAVAVYPRAVALIIG